MTGHAAEMARLLAGVEADLGTGSLRPDGEGQWTAVLGGTDIAVIEHDADRGRIVVSVPVGLLPDDRTAEAQAVLLRLGFLWREGGGVCPALDDADNVVLSYQCGLDGLRPRDVVALLGNMSELGRKWSELLDSLDTISTEDGGPPMPPSPPAGGMFV